MTWTFIVIGVVFFFTVGLRSLLHQKNSKKKWAASWQNQQNYLSVQWRLRSAWASAQSDQSLRCPHLLSAQWRLWSDWADAQADLSLRWAQRSFCWFCHEAAQLWFVSKQDMLLNHYDIWCIVGQSNDFINRFVFAYSKSIYFCMGLIFLVWRNKFSLKLKKK